MTSPTGLKSHDYHKMTQHVLPMVLYYCDADSDKIRLQQVVYDLRALFRWTVFFNTCYTYLMHDI